ncbi:FAD/NAD(P)-binding protein [Alteromonas ponticola]|uniref:FAD-dependent urate hydroxylase HpyO/Asp monooxygenase CreE-like FAD/NAD(P)-binding domain-containing protein n=1 Tax=Alteromonas ponticola TaxID=2720613 RepID=A0ABX1R289_9ALTE|nr:FAD/NAD(P)-binding protein [Alteromonas ponticola]NMH60572.1 hypothetical protein [Alteromonas ponticola]
MLSRMEMLASVNERPKIAVVGAGPATVYLLYHLYQARLTSVDIDIFEASAYQGCGHAFNPETSYPNLLSNLHPDDIPSLPLNYYEWNAATVGGESFPPHSVLSRSTVGRFLAANFLWLIHELERRHVVINVYPDHFVEKLCESENGCQLQADGRWYVGYSAIVNNTGLINPAEGTPYPLDVYRYIGQPRFTIFGSSLTAVDAILTIAQANGQFAGEAQDLIYRPNYTYNIEVVSPSGVFPNLWYPSSRQWQITTMMKGRFTEELSSFDSLYEALCLPALACYCPDVYRQIARMKFETALRFLTQTYTCCEARRKLHCELLAFDAIESQGRFHWQEVIDAFLSLIETSGLHLNAVSIRQNNRFPHALTAKALGALPIESARKLLALFVTGTLNTRQGSMATSDAIKSYPHHVVMDCRGVKPEKREQGNNKQSAHAVKFCEVTTRIFAGSPHQRTNALTLPGLDTCNRLNRTIAKNLIDMTNGVNRALSTISLEGV